MRRNRRAKVVATLGPSSSTPETIKELYLAGADVFRLNFSHGSYDDHKARFDAIRALEAEIGRPVGILQDLQGPKIRIGTLRDGVRTLTAGETVTFILGETAGEAIPLPHPEIFEAIAVGHHLLIDDGRLKLKVTSCMSDTIEAKVIYGGPLSDRKGVNLPDTVVKLSPLTEKDRADLEFGLSLGVDWVALSFVQRPSDMLEARELVGDKAGLMAKIEKPTALESIEDIIRLSDAIMVARGDLGVEIPPEDVPGRQKELVRKCRLAGKPVLVATQMLDSMTKAPAPTRAEASDVATAIYDGADAVMLSAESAAGDYPVESVAFMDRMIARTEDDKAYRSIITALEPAVEPTIQHAVSAAASSVASMIGAKAILAYTMSGSTGARIARMRPEVPIIIASPDLNIVRRMVLLWGAHPIQHQEISSFREMVQRARNHVIDEGFCEHNDRAVVVAGVPFGVRGSTNNLRVIEV